MLMHQVLRDGAARTPDKIALRWVDRGLALGFADAVAAMERYAGALHALGVRKGDRVTIFAHNGMDYALGLFACWRIGAIAALVNVRFVDELDYYFADHTPTVVIYTHDMGGAGARCSRARAERQASRLHGRAAGRRAKSARAPGGKPAGAARSGRRKRHRASVLHVRHDRQAEGRVPRARADHARVPLHCRAAAHHA